VSGDLSIWARIWVAIMIEISQFRVGWALRCTCKIGLSATVPWILCIPLGPFNVLCMW
jgi:hypothetical protein